MADQELVTTTTHLCKVCGKMFSNGRSLGGHMRSHLSLLSSFEDVFDDDDQEEEEEAEDVGLGSQSSDVSEVVVIKKRRRRVRRVAAITSDTLSVSESEKEDGALSLMMLSRDYCSIKKHSLPSDDDDDAIGSELDVYGKKSNLKRKRVSQFDPNGSAEAKKGKRYKCVTCNKVFSSYQALGGHRTSHRKSEAYLSSLESNSPVGSSSVEETVGRSSSQRRRNDHECPICHKVFASGQALGGHKRSHLVSVAETVSIDLNFPAPD